MQKLKDNQILYRQPIDWLKIDDEIRVVNTLIANLLNILVPLLGESDSITEFHRYMKLENNVSNIMRYRNHLLVLMERKIKRNEQKTRVGNT